MTFSESISTCLKKYFVFEGRASRSEYWWFQLVVIPFYFISEIVVEGPASYFFLIIALFLLIPAIAAGVRRIHDVNKSGFYILLGLIPFIGGLILLFFLIPEGTKGKNNYGPDPIIRTVKNIKKKKNYKTTVKSMTELYKKRGLKNPKILAKKYMKGYSSKKK